MNRFDLCIIQSNNPDFNGAFAIILDEDIENYCHVEIWKFEKNQGAELDFILRDELRLATENEMEEYQIKFKEYCNKNENPQT